MLTVFLSHAASVLDGFCEAPRAMPTIHRGYRLQHITILTRHGQRTPMKAMLPPQARGRWVCDDETARASRMEAAPSKYYRYYEMILNPEFIDYPPSCRAGDLTTYGQKQHEMLGAAYRKFLVDDLKFLPEKMKPQLFSFHASHVERTFRSAESFISGLYPPLSDNEVLTITTPTELSNPYDARMCKEFKEQKAEWKKSPEYTQFVKDILPAIEGPLNELHLTKDQAGAHELCRWVVAFNCSEGSVSPTWLTDEAVEACKRETWMGMYGLYNYTTDRAVLASPIMREIIRINDEALQSGKKFALISAHDTTLAAILMFLGFYKDITPPYASHVAVELLLDKDDTKFISFAFNGEEVKMPLFQNRSIVKYDEFINVITPLIDHCRDITDI